MTLPAACPYAILFDRRRPAGEGSYYWHHAAAFAAVDAAVVVVGLKTAVIDEYVLQLGVIDVAVAAAVTDLPSVEGGAVVHYL
jgi:hypothetical protein